ERVEEMNRASPALDLSVRVAVNTGEAFVRLASGPQVGENVAGDVVNTASRLQSVAPPGGVVVGEGTYRATRDAIAYSALDPVTVKGKARPLSVWLANSVAWAPGSRRAAWATPFVGRAKELAILEGLLDRSVRER